MSDDFSRTLDDVIAGFQGMHATVQSFAGPSGSGAVPMAMTPGGAAIPTPPPPTPLLTTPPAATPMIAAPPPTPVYPPPPPMPPQPFIPMTSAPPMPAMMHDPTAGMSAMYQQGMQHARSTYVQNPTYAGAMDPTFGVPSAGMMTNPGMGIFRQSPVSDPRVSAPFSVTGQAPPTPLVPMPSLFRTRPGYEFARPFEAATYSGSEFERLRMQGFSGFAEGAGAAFTGAVGSTIGGLGGAAIGGFFGGVGGASAGMTAGQIGGALAAFHPGVNRAMGALMRPAIEQRADELQLQSASRRFVMGGRGLDITGSGLGEREAGRLGTAFSRMARESGGEVTRQDIVQMTQLAGEQGLLDAAQNADQIADVMKSMMSLVGTMAKVTGDPDFRNNIQRIAQMKQLGIGMGDMDVATQNLAHFARMAGVSVDQVMSREGRQGAVVYQGAGLNAGQGMLQGAMSAGQARGLEASGALSQEQMSLLGGQSGVAQRLTEMQAAMMSGPNRALMGAIVRRGEGDRLELDPDALRRLRSGELSYEDALRQGNQAFRQDSRLLGDVFARMPELQMEMGNQLGPMGQQQLLMSVLRQIGDRTGMDMRQAAISMSGGDQRMGMIVDAMRDPRFQRMMSQQQQAEMSQRQFEAFQADQAAADAEPGYLSRQFRRGLIGMGLTPGELSPRGLQERGAAFLRERERRARIEASGGRIIETGDVIDVGETGTSVSMEERQALAREFGTFRRGTFATVLGGIGEEQEALFSESAALRAARETSGQGGMFRRVRGAANMLFNPFETYQGTINRERGLTAAQRESIGANVMAVGLSGDRQLAATQGAMERVGGQRFLGAATRLSRIIKDRVGVGLGREQMVSDAEIAEAFGGAVPEGMSQGDRAALIAEALGRAGAEGREARREIAETAADVTAEAMQDEFGGDGGLEAQLRDMGFGARDLGLGLWSSQGALSDPEKRVLQRLAGDPTEVAYLLLVALQADGDERADRLEAGMLKAHGPEEHTQRRRAAQNVFDSLSQEERDLLMARAPTIAGKAVMKALQKDGGGKKAYDSLTKRAGAIGKGLRVAQRDQNNERLRSHLVKKHVHGVGSAKELLGRMRGAEGAELRQLRDAFGEGIVQQARSMDMGDEAAITRFEETVMASVGTEGDIVVQGGELRGLSSEGTRDLAQQMAIQSEMSAQMIDASRDNARATDANTRALNAVASALQGEGGAPGIQSEVE